MQDMVCWWKFCDTSFYGGIFLFPSILMYSVLRNLSSMNQWETKTRILWVFFADEYLRYLTHVKSNSVVYLLLTIIGVCLRGNRVCYWWNSWPSCTQIVSNMILTLRYRICIILSMCSCKYLRIIRPSMPEWKGCCPSFCFRCAICDCAKWYILAVSTRSNQWFLEERSPHNIPGATYFMY
jgi:hypothetical protein